MHTTHTSSYMLLTLPKWQSLNDNSGNATEVVMTLLLFGDQWQGNCPFMFSTMQSFLQILSSPIGRNCSCGKLSVQSVIPRTSFQNLLVREPPNFQSALYQWMKINNTDQNRCLSRTAVCDRLLSISQWDTDRARFLSDPSLSMPLRSFSKVTGRICSSPNKAWLCKAFQGGVQLRIWMSDCRITNRKAISLPRGVSFWHRICMGCEQESPCCGRALE